VLYLALALPDNPPNLLTQLFFGTAGTEQWVVLGMTCVIILGPGFVSHTFTECIIKITSRRVKKKSGKLLQI
jgi:hypothetical protein